MRHNYGGINTNQLGKQNALPLCLSVIDVLAVNGVPFSESSRRGVEYMIFQGKPGHIKAALTNLVADRIPKPCSLVW